MSLVIRKRRPVIGFLLVAGAVTALLVTGLFAYRQGGADAESELTRNAIEARLMQDSLLQMSGENTRLREKLVLVERTLEVEKQAWQTINEQLKQLQDETHHLKEELRFYHSVVTEESVRGLQIRDLNLKQLENGKLRYNLVLTRDMKNGKVLKGTVELKLSGMMGKKKARLGMKELSGEPRVSIRIKHYQRLSGDISLPDGFEPKSLTVSVKPSGRKSKRIEKKFDWVTLAG